MILLLPPHLLLKFKSRKHSKSESIYLRRDWIKQTANTIIISLPKCAPIEFWTGNNAWHGPILMDCRLQRTWTNDFFLCIPHAFEVERQDLDKSQEEGKSLRVCALDPGVRTFQTIFDASEGAVLEIGAGDMQSIFRLCKQVDKLVSKQAKAKQSHVRSHLKRAARRLRVRIQNIVNEVHKQLAKHLASSYDLIMLPSFNTSQMVQKKNRKISSVTARQMLTWAHYRFKQRLIFKCRQYNSKVAIVSEVLTSKTCSCCGSINQQLGSSKVFTCPNTACNAVMDRDMNAAKNIFLRNFEALGLSVQGSLALGPTPCDLVTDRCTEGIARGLLPVFQIRTNLKFLE